MYPATWSQHVAIIYISYHIHVIQLAMLSFVITSWKAEKVMVLLTQFSYVRSNVQLS